MDLRDALKNVGAMRLAIKPGDVCLVEDTAVVIPETPDEERTYHENGRPCVVLSSERLCVRQSHPIVSIAPISHLVNLKDEDDFPLKPTNENGLRQDSLVMLGHLQPVRKVDIFKIIGKLSDIEWDFMLAHLVDNFYR